MLESATPRRILILSADMGEGHNATGRALRAAAGRLWPDASTHWLDTLDVMGRGVGPVFRRIYVANVERTPWLYEFFYDSVWRYRWFARASKRFVGEWAGRRLAARVDRIQPDLILSTYPLGTAGLDWLRRHRGLEAPIGAWVSDFAPHPFWVYQGIDLNLVMHEVAVPVAARSAPGATVAISAPTADEVFRPGDRAAARAELDLPQDKFVSLVACGSLGFGRSEDTVKELLVGTPDGIVVVVCGRNERLRARIRAAIGDDVRVRILGWTDQMATLMVAADVVVTNAGGATSLEALAVGRPVLMHRPIAAHGRANAQLMADAGIAVVCRRDGELAAAVRDQPRLAQMERLALKQADERLVEEGLLALQSARPERLGRVLSAEDSLFVHIASPRVPQHVGTIMEMSGEVSVEDVAGMLDAMHGVRGHVDPGSWLRRPRWLQDETVDTKALVSEVDGVSLQEAVDSFYAKPLPARATAEALIVHGASPAVLIKLHHALGDGVAVLRGLLTGTSGKGKAWGSPVGHQVSHKLPRLRLKGLLALARAGSVPRGSKFGASRRFGLVKLPGVEVRATARALGATPTELLLAMFALAHQGDQLRVMVPWSLRGTDTLRAAGNWTGAVSVDLPVQETDPLRCLELVRDALRAGVASGAPEAANWVVRLIGLLPAPAHRLLARLVYQSRWFGAIASVIPGPRWKVLVGDAEIEAAYAVLPLAEGVPIAWGALTWGRHVTVCVTGGGAVDGAALGDRMVDALREFSGGTP
ncbi:WS/DGAT domain-containing protein [Kutzneria sp. NPDC052558]|uniref:WS/DGAT domain-containing protein n=1 Tax=Kutzneria sp. NPDC052558 TaxID=3364121 RepID=UPI0037C6D405